MPAPSPATAPDAVYHAQGDRLRASALARGPWDEHAQHGGAPAAVLMRAFEALPAAEGLQIARVTYEFLRPVPIALLEVCTEVIRPGRRVQLLEGTIRDEQGREVVRARALQVQRARTRQPLGEPEPPPHPAGEGRENDMVPPFSPMFAPDAIEIRFAEGSFHERGPAVAWFRLRIPLVAGEQPSALQRLAAAGDFGNGISTPLSWRNHLFINPDLTLYVERVPRGDWLCLDARTRIAPDGVGVSQSVIFDAHGRVGRATQALLVAPR